MTAAATKPERRTWMESEPGFLEESGGKQNHGVKALEKRERVKKYNQDLHLMLNNVDISNPNWK